MKKPRWHRGAFCWALPSGARGSANSRHRRGPTWWGYPTTGLRAWSPPFRLIVIAVLDDLVGGLFALLLDDHLIPPITAQSIIGRRAFWFREPRNQAVE